MLRTRQHRHVYSHYRPKNYHLSQSVREKQLTKDSQSKSESDGLSKMCFGQHAHVTLIIARPRCYRNLGSEIDEPHGVPPIKQVQITDLPTVFSAFTQTGAAFTLRSCHNGQKWTEKQFEFAQEGDKLELKLNSIKCLRFRYK